MKFQPRLIEAVPKIFFFSRSGSSPERATTRPHEPEPKEASMSTKPQPAARAEDVEFARATISIIAKTRSHWSIRSDRYLAPETAIAVGLGSATLTRDGETVYEEDQEHEPMTVAQAEKLARREADHDWRIHLVAQLEDRHYRRVGAGRWQIYERGYGLS
jgi:hypothetical protein